MKYKYRVKDLSRGRHKKELKIIFKTCRECKNIMPLDKFRKSKGYYLSICRKCEHIVATKKSVKTCEYCGQTYTSKHKNSKFCSSECFNKSIKNGMIINCAICGKEFYISKSRIGRVHCCSNECGRKYTGLKNSGEKHPGWKGGISIIEKEYNCDYCGKSIFRTETVYNSHKNHFCSKDCEYAWRSETFRGENSPFWNPNLSEEDRINGRNIPKYKEFINNTYKRDNYTCQCCGDDKGGNLVVHHLNGYNWDVENRTNIDNGITLCEDCHRRFHNTYGYGYNTKEQFEEWIKNKLKRVS